MTLFKLLLCSFTLDTFITASASSENTGSSPDVFPCTLANSFEYYTGITVSTCIKKCQRRIICAAINYNRYSAFCALRNSSFVELSGLEPAWCYDIVINNKTGLLKGPCKDKPCDDTSVCKDSTTEPLFTCTQTYCKPETIISNASFINKVLSSIGGKNQLRCDTGYTPLGPMSLTCLPDGNWSPTDLQCLKTCPSIPLKTTATVRSWSTYRFVVNTTATYTCKEGFYNITERAIVCDEFGNWSAFECLPYCRQAHLIPIENGYPKTGDNYTIYMRAEYTCGPEHYLSPGSMFVTCDAYEQWSRPEVSCFRFCKQADIPLVTHGNPLFGTRYNFTMTTEYSCDTDYYLSAGSPKLSCDTKGSWSTPEIECYPYCQQPKIVNGFLQSSISEPIKKDESALFGCNNDYYAHPSTDAPTATCLKTGAWTFSASCYKYCDSAPGYIREAVDGYSAPAPYKVGTVASYRCVAGGLAHFNGGDGKKYCNNQGHWDGEVHCCARCYKYKNGRCKLDLCLG